MMSIATQALGLICSGLFAGGTMMELIVEHPARLSADNDTASDQMQRVLKRADPLMPGLASGGLLFGIATFYLGGSLPSLVGGILMGSVIVFTLTVVLPVHKRLLAGSAAPADLKLDMRRWGRLHAIRSFAALAAFILMVSGTSL